MSDKDVIIIDEEGNAKVPDAIAPDEEIRFDEADKTKEVKEVIDEKIEDSKAPEMVNEDGVVFADENFNDVQSSTLDEVETPPIVLDGELDDDRGKEDTYESICVICKRPESVAGKMLNLPNNMTVCEDCMKRSFDA